MKKKLVSHYVRSNTENSQEKLLLARRELAILYSVLQKIVARGYIPGGVFVKTVLEAAKEIKEDPNSGRPSCWP